MITKQQHKMHEISSHHNYQFLYNQLAAARGNYQAWRPALAGLPSLSRAGSSLPRYEASSGLYQGSARLELGSEGRFSRSGWTYGWARGKRGREDLNAVISVTRRGGRLAGAEASSVAASTASCSPAEGLSAPLTMTGVSGWPAPPSHMDTTWQDSFLRLSVLAMCWV